MPAATLKRMNHFLAASVVAALTACGGGGGGGAATPSPAAPTPSPPAETLFVKENSWTSAIPADAEMVTPEEFRRRQTAGEIGLITDTSRLAVKTAEDRRVADAQAFLESKTDLSPDVKDLLDRAHAGKSEVSEAGMIELGPRIENAADAYRRAHDPGNALAAYRATFGLLPAEIQATLASPDSLQSATLDQIGEATAAMNTALHSLPEIDHVRLDPDAPPVLQKSGPGNGADNSGTCTQTGLARRYWFPLRSFVSPVKNQGNRGTCWAFAAIAAVESRERVQNDNAVDLSEQFLVNKYKREWFESDYVDGGSAASALNSAVDHNQALLGEGGWTYNLALKRDPKAEGNAAAYDRTCDDYNGWCSPTAHESSPSCTSVGFLNFCSYDKYTFNGPGVTASRDVQLWANGQAFNLDQYRALLGSGVSLMASFPVYVGFDEAAAGVVSDYRKQTRDGKGMLVDGARGGHLVQVVGFISNEQMSFPGSPVNIGGGGYFIIRNSWHCAGDGGYYYVPADYVSQLFSTLEMLDFDGRRSNRWNAEQVAPGGTTGLAVDGRGAGIVGLRIQENLAGMFSVSHPVANYVRLTVTSDRDGVLYDGQWMVNPPVGGSLFANSLPVNFQTEGLRTLTLTARYGTQAVSSTKVITVLNSSPTISLRGNGAAAEGEDFVVDALIADTNESDFTPLCDATVWNVTAPDVIVSGTGCTRVIRFGTAGNRQVQVSTHDREGAPAASIATFFVSPPPANPYPRITGYGLYSRDSLLIQGQFFGCIDHGVANNAVIDLRQQGCSWSVSDPSPWKYVAKLTLDNPVGEALSYDWTYSLSYVAGGPVIKSGVQHTTVPTFDYYPTIFGGRDAPYPCTLDVRVNAPDAARNKTLRVWTGQCINVEDAPR